MSASGSVTGNGRFDQGYVAGVPTVPFNLTADLDDIRTAAIASNAHFPDSGALGYQVTVNGSSVTIAKITDGVTTGDFVTVPVTVMSIPASGVIYFDGATGSDGSLHSIWVQGNYSAPLTIVSATNIYITGDYGPSDSNSTVTSALIANGSIIVPSWFKATKDTMTADAALLSVTGAIYADIKRGVTRSMIDITGSLASYDSAGSFVSYNTSGDPIAGFKQAVYAYDQRLNVYPPPMYPVVQDGSLKVDTWIEDKSFAQ